MFQSFAVIGTALAFLGLVYTFIFVRLILRNFKTSETLLSLSEALVTVFIGVFYLYSAMILASKGSPDNLGTDFTNTIDDIVTRNDTYETYYHAISVTNPTTPRSEDENKPTEENISKGPDNLSNSSSFGEISEQLAEVSKTDQFLMNYQKFIKTMMKEKIANSSLSNQTFVGIESLPSQLRTRRDIKVEEETPNCYYEFFLQNALLLYSFVHCLITLLNKTLYCKKCISVQDDLASKGESIKQESNPANIWTSESDSKSEENDSSAPVGPLFETNQASTSTDVPNLKLFEVKIPKLQTTDRTEVAKQTPTPEGDATKPIKYKFILQILFMWALPVLCVIVLYCITKLEPSENLGYDVSFLNAINFTATQPDPHLASIIQSPLNISEENSTEIDQIIKNVYSIVGQVRENVTKKTTYFTPMMIDIVYFLKPNHRNPKDFEGSCPKIDTSVKLFYFFVFVAAFFGVILYAKIVQTSAETKNIESAQHQKNSLMSFSLLWLPSVLELFFRAYVGDGKPSVLTDLFLALGNTNRIYTMASNHLQTKKHLSKQNFVNPLV